MWLLPSRRRPANLARFFAAHEKAGGSTPGMVIVDYRDWRDLCDKYSALKLPLGWNFRLTEGETQGDKIREVWAEVKDCAWLGLIGDDCVPETPQWDRRLVAHLERSLIVSCDDGWQAPKRLGNCWIMAGELTRALGYIFPPGLHHLFVDDVWETIGREAGCWRCDMDIRVAHRHVLNKQAEADDTHRLVYGSDTSNPDGGMWPGDREAYATWRDGLRAEAVAAARGLRGDAAPEDSDRLSIERAKSRSVLICTPIGRQPAPEYVVSLVNTTALLSKLKIRHECRFVIGSSNLPRARNQLVAEFLASGFDDMLFVDDDMGWRADAVVRLLASEHDVIGGVGRKRVDKPNTDGEVWCVKWLDPPFKQVQGAIEVAGVGTGFMCISRAALEQIVEKRPEILRHGELMPGLPTYHRFFYWGDDGESELSEDYQFCADWRALGGSVWIDPKIGLSHVGSKAYAGCVDEILMPL